MHNLAQTLAAELAPRRIRVNSVSPGYIDTPAFRAETSHEARAVIGATLAAGRVGTAEEVAAAVAFLPPTRPPTSTARTSSSRAV